MKAPLAGRVVVVTRPQGQGDRLCRLLCAAGAEVLRLPVIAIAPPADPAAARAILEQAPPGAPFIFISSNAVEQAERVAPGLIASRHGPLLAVGPATAAALRRLGGREVVLPAAGSDSEALLRLPALSPDTVAGQTVVIVRGEGGRELLARELRRRGAEVRYAEVYRRERPELDPSPLLERWRQGHDVTLLITSIEGLENLFAMIPRQWHEALKGSRLLLASERIARAAREAGCTRVAVSQGAGDAALLRALVAERPPGEEQSRPGTEHE